MAVTVSEFRTRFPEFSDSAEYSDARINLFIDDTTLYIGNQENHWCGHYNKAQAYLAAHLLVSATETEASGGVGTSAKVGVVTSKSAGGVSVTRSVSTKERSDQDEFFMTTPYGQNYIVIRSTCFVGVAVTGCW